MNPINRRAFLQQAGLAAALAGCARTGLLEARLRRPNLLYIMSDDLGYADLGFMGRRDYTTPVLDNFAREGVRLTQAYCAAPVCTPTRVALNTGRYPARSRAGLFEPLTTSDDGLLPTPKTLGGLIRDEGYDTALIGKWHLGLLPQYHPLRHGYDEFYGFLGAAADYSSHIDTETHKSEFQDGDKPVKIDGYLTDLFTDRAVQFVTKARNRPFFLNLEYNAPHWPWQGPGDPPYPDSINTSDGGSPQVYARMVQRMDEGIGKILTALRNAGLERDTLVIFQSDNGGERYSDMGPLSHGKMTLYEGGIRTPAVARWPGVIRPNTTTDQVSVTFDWTATLVKLAGGKADGAAPFDGIDLLPALTGAAPVSRDLFWRIFQRRKQKAMRSGNWKYLAAPEGEFLFDLSQDIGEKHNLAGDRANTLVMLREKYAEWERQVLTPIALSDTH